MKIIKTKFKDLIIVKTKKNFDKRGYLSEVFNNKILKVKFKFQLVSCSKKNVVRGLHFQKKNAQGKLITIFKGSVYDVAVDLRKNSKTFGKYFSVILSAKNSKSFYIPPGFAHGFCTLEDNTIMHYNLTNLRDKKNEVGILWNDPDINIKWPTKKPIVSKKDQQNIYFKDFF